MGAKENGQADRKPILELATLAPVRPFATIDGVEHEFRLMQEFGAVEHQEFTRDSAHYDSLFRQDKKLTKTESDRLERLLDRLFSKVLVHPDVLREQLGEKLTGAIKRELVLTFSNAPLLMEAMALSENETTTAETSTTES